MSKPPKKSEFDSNSNVNMGIEALDGNVIAQIRSSSTIDSITQCVTELVLNSLDAKSTAIAVRVNISDFRMQVVDNGRGISRSNLEFVGQRYMTNKCHSLSDLKGRIASYGFRGEALASISRISRRVSITTREQNSDETYRKIIEGDGVKIDQVQTRPSFGTTVTVEGFLCNLPVRQQCIRGNELENVRKSLENLVIIQPRVAFSLRNDLTRKIILESRRSPDIAGSFKNLHPEIDEDAFALYKVRKNKTSVEGLIHKEFQENRRLQYLYVNKRPITCPSLQNFVAFCFKKAKAGDSKKTQPIFVIHIKCPYSDVDLSLEPTKTVVFFKKWDLVRRCVDKMIRAFLGGGNRELTPPKCDETRSEYGISQIGGAVKAAIKRKNSDVEDTVANKSSRIEEDTPAIVEARIVKKQVKKALPIEIKRNEKEEETHFDDIKENSLYTNFPDNEKKGKDIIMDMFIKSVQVFPKENGSCGSPAETSADSVSEVKDNMVSVGVQAGRSDVDRRDEISLLGNVNDVTFLPRKSLKNYVSDYNFDFSKLEAIPNCNAVSNDFAVFNDMSTTKKLFDFRGGHFKPSNIFAHRAPLSAPYFDDFGNDTFKMTIEKCFSKKKTARKNFETVQQSPFFSDKSKPRSLLSLKRPYRSQPVRGGTSTETINIDHGGEIQEKHFLDVSLDIKSLNQVSMVCSRRNKTRKKLNESVVSSFFAPPPQKQEFDESKDLFSSRPSSGIVITIDEGDKQSLIERDLAHDKHDDIIPSTLTLRQNDRSKGVGLKNELSFEIRERFEFVPKGLSPILKSYGKVEEMSPESKENLQNAVIQEYEDELLLVKWQNCIAAKDPEKFFEEMYIEKSKSIEAVVPNIAKTALAKREIFENFSFTKEVFENLEVIGQVDCKFIATLEKSRNLILLFDQHAVHERVRLEQLSESYKNAITKIDQDIMIFLPVNDLGLVKKHKLNMYSLGLGFDIYRDGINIHQVPLCIYNKFKKGANLTTLTETLIKEVIETLKANNGILVNTPRLVQNIINSEACRGAIKFGDVLTKTECFIHLKQLAGCTLPFQCAHGRPTLTPLISLKKFDDTSKKTKLRNLLSY